MSEIVRQESGSEITGESLIVAALQRGVPFTARSGSGSFRIRVADCVPVVATAVHDGHRIPAPFAGRMAISGAARRFEEDPYTGEIAGLFPVSLIAVDSRYLYDLNRAPESCIYDHAWGRRVWSEAPGEREREHLRRLHGGYYRVLDALLTVLETRFGGCVVYDLHSYNYSRLDGSPPLFNIGTHFIDRRRFGPVLDRLLEKLAAIELDGNTCRVSCDEVFEGKGYQARFIREHHPDTLCIPLELKKIFMDEERFTLDEPLFARLKAGLFEALTSTGDVFRKNLGAGDANDRCRQ